MLISSKDMKTRCPMCGFGCLVKRTHIKWFKVFSYTTCHGIKYYNDTGGVDVVYKCPYISKLKYFKYEKDKCRPMDWDDYTDMYCARNGKYDFISIEEALTNDISLFVMKNHLKNNSK